MTRRWLVLLLLAAACGGDRVADLEQRVARLEQQLKQEREPAAVPGDAAAAVARDLEDLRAALRRRQSAIATLDEPGGKEATAALERALAALRGRRELALAQLQQALGTADADLQPALVEVYGQLGGIGAVPVLQAWLHDAHRSPAVRVTAARSVIQADPAAAPALVGGLLRGEPAFPDLYLLVHLLGGTGRSEAVPVLVQALQCPDRSVRCHAATALGAFRDEAAVAALCSTATDDEYPAVRANALRALQRAGDPARIVAVKARVLAREQDAAVRAAATDLPGR